jgi:septum formation protein
VLESQPVSEKNTLILASNSPRRRQLLSLGGWKFSVSVADVDESQLPAESPGDYVLRLARIKAHKSAENVNHQSVVIAADTTVVDGDDILGKPVDELEAIRMLKRLRGHTHQVYTGLALLRVSDGHTLRHRSCREPRPEPGRRHAGARRQAQDSALTDLSITDVPMRDYSDEEIDAYVQTGDPLDKAGAYAIQHPDFHPVENLAGCFASVMGLPLCRLTYLLRQFEIYPVTEVGLRCQTELQYDCPVSDAILRGAVVS